MIRNQSEHRPRRFVSAAVVAGGIGGALGLGLLAAPPAYASPPGTNNNGCFGLETGYYAQLASPPGYSANSGNTPAVTKEQACAVLRS